MRTLVASALVCLVLAACTGDAPGPAGPVDESQREPAEQAFGPDYPAQAPAGSGTRIDSAELSADQLTLTVHFIGGKPYLASDPCSEDYEPWVVKHGDELDVAVINVERVGQAHLGLNTGCTMEGHLLVYHLKLAAPFTGATVNDLANRGTLYVGTPPGAAALTEVPAGWSMQRGFEEEPGPPPVWVQVYAAGPFDPLIEGPIAPWEGPGRLVLYEAFGSYGEWSDTRAAKSEERGGHAVAATMNGGPATVWFDETSGELLLAWTMDGHSFGLIGNAADMAADELVGYAESVTTAKP